MPKVVEDKKVASKSEEKAGEAPKKETKKAVKDDLFAIFTTGGKQYKASVGEKVKIEKIKGEFKEGDEITFDKVLLVDDGKDTSIGTPYIPQAKITATLEKIAKAKKVEVLRYKAKSNYLKRNGHRQPYFEVKITAIK